MLKTKIYKILKVLVKKGYIEVMQGTSTYYRFDPEQVVGKIKGEFLKRAIKELGQFNELIHEFPKTDNLGLKARPDYSL